LGGNSAQCPYEDAVHVFAVAGGDNSVRHIWLMTMVETSVAMVVLHAGLKGTSNLSSVDLRKRCCIHPENFRIYFQLRLT
jgi:hypothetical protein